METPCLSTESTEVSAAPTRRPFVFVNMAMTADGKTASPDGRIASFGSRRDLNHLYELRATSDAVMTGARTLNSHPVTLGSGGARFVRLRQRAGLREQALRIVVSGAGSLSPDAEIFRAEGAPILLITTQACSQAWLDQMMPQVSAVWQAAGNTMDWLPCLAWMRETWGIQRLLCEGGAALTGSLFQSNLVDELHLTLCPKLLGGRNSATIADSPERTPMAEARAMTLHHIRRHKDELFLVYRRD